METHVMDGVITSSPGPIFMAFKARCIPAVAEASATDLAQPVYSQNFSSNSAFFEPVVIHPERRTSPTAAISASVMLGRENGKNSFLMDIVIQVL